jgi:hypothetical protein
MDKKIEYIEIDIIGTEINLLSIEIDEIDAIKRPYAIGANIKCLICANKSNNINRC